MQTNKVFSADNSLHLAAEKDDIDALEKLLNAGRAIDELHSETRITALATACAHGKLAAVQYLLNKKADIAAGGLRMRRSVLDYALNDLAIASLLLDKIREKVDSYKDSSEKKGDERAKIALLAFSLFNYFWAQGEQELAKKYFQKGLSISRNLTNNTAISSALEWLVASGYLKQSMFEQAKGFFEKSLKAYAGGEFIFAIQAVQDTLYETLKAKQNNLVKLALDSLFLRFPKENNFKFFTQTAINISLIILKEGDAEQASNIVDYFFKNLPVIGEHAEDTEIREANTLIAEFILELVPSYRNQGNFNTAFKLLEIANKLAVESSNLKLKNKIELTRSSYKQAQEIDNQYKTFLNKFLQAKARNDIASEVSNFIEASKKYRQLSGSSLNRIKRFGATVNNYEKILNLKKFNEKHEEWLNNLKEFYELAVVVEDDTAFKGIINILYSLLERVTKEKITDIKLIFTTLELINLCLKCSVYLNNKDGINMAVARLVEFLKKSHGLKGTYLGNDYFKECDKNILTIMDYCLVLQNENNIIHPRTFTTLRIFRIGLLIRQSSFNEVFNECHQILPEILEDEISTNTHTVMGFINGLLDGDFNFAEEVIELVLKSTQGLMRLLAGKRDSSNLNKLAPPFLRNCFKYAQSYKQKKNYAKAINCYLMYLEYCHLDDEPKIAASVKALSFCLAQLPLSNTASDFTLFFDNLSNCISKLMQFNLSDKISLLLNQIYSSIEHISETTYKIKAFELLLNTYQNLRNNDYKQEQAYCSYQLAISLFQQQGYSAHAEQIIALLRTARKYYNLFPDYQPLKDLDKKSLEMQLALADHYLQINEHTTALQLYNLALDEVLPDNKTTLSDTAINILQKANQLNLLLAQQNAEQNKLNTAICFYENAIENYKLLKDTQDEIATFKNKQTLILLYAQQYLSVKKFEKAIATCHEALSAFEYYYSLALSNRHELEPFTSKFADLLNQINKEKYDYYSDNKNYNLSTEGTRLPRNPLLSASNKEEKPDIVPPTTASLITSTVDHNRPPRTFFAGGKVGNRIQADFLGEGQGNLYPVFAKDAKAIQKLKKTNKYRYKEFKRVILEGGAVNSFGHSGLKYIGFWEAKIDSPGRMFPLQDAQTDSETNAKYLVFDGYSKKGFHRS